MPSPPAAPAASHVATVGVTARGARVGATKRRKDTSEVRAEAACIFRGGRLGSELSLESDLLHSNSSREQPRCMRAMQATGRCT